MADGPKLAMVKSLNSDADCTILLKFGMWVHYGPRDESWEQNWTGGLKWQCYANYYLFYLVLLFKSSCQINPVAKRLVYLLVEFMMLYKFRCIASCIAW